MAIKIGGILFFVSLIIGLYFLNAGLDIVALTFIPDAVTKWIMVLGGILVIVGGFFAMRALTPAHRKL